MQSSELLRVIGSLVLGRTTCFPSLFEEPEKFVRAYEFCREVLYRTLKEARPGASCLEIFRTTQRMACDQGYEENYLGLPVRKAIFVGHGVGLEASETPLFALRQDYPLEAGVTVAIEPKVVFPGEGVLGLENTYLITEQGNEKLTPMGDDIIQV